MSSRIPTYTAPSAGSSWHFSASIESNSARKPPRWKLSRRDKGLQPRVLTGFNPGFRRTRRSLPGLQPPECRQISTHGLRIRMVRPEPGLEDRQRPLIVRMGSRKISLALKKATEVVQAGGGVRVLRTQNLLPDRQRALKVRTGSPKISLAFKKATEVVQAL